jgi:hypothetical protein
MNLSLISFVGVDSYSNFNELLKFNTAIKCEFSVLYSASRKDNRYPNYDFCNKFLSWSRENDILGSIHLCGEIINNYLNEDPKTINLCNLASRVQLNLNIKKFIDYEKLSNNIINVAYNNDNHIILQKNKTKIKFNKVFLEKCNNIKLSLLHDSSGGFGKEINHIDPPGEIYTGYAGGINPNNVCGIIKLIEDSNHAKKPYYIDMESGVRENDLFSLNKCREIIENINGM